MKKAIAGLVVLFTMMPFHDTFAQQNIQFSQYIFNTLAVNPAYAGFKEDWYLQMAHRRQWVGLGNYNENDGNDGNGAPVTTQISVDGVINPLSRNVGVGLQFTDDNLGAQSATSLYANYAYRIQLDRADMSRLCFGLAAGVSRYSTDIRKLRPYDPGDPLLDYDKPVGSYVPDVRFGIYYYNPKFYVGFSAMDLLAKKEISISSPEIDSICNIMRRTHYYLMGGALFELTGYTRFRPSILIREDLKGPTSVDLSGNFIFDNRFWIGASYRAGLKLWKNYGNEESLSVTNALVGLVNFQVTDKLRIGYSYDYALNSFNGAQDGTHELTVGLLLSRRSKRVLSPRFF